MIQYFPKRYSRSCKNVKTKLDLYYSARKQQVLMQMLQGLQIKKYTICLVTETNFITKVTEIESEILSVTDIVKKTSSNTAAKLATKKYIKIVLDYIIADTKKNT